MSFRDCITAKAFRKLLEENKAQEALDMYDDLVDEMRAQGMDAAKAEAKAAIDTQTILTADKAAKKKATVAAINAQQRIVDNMRGYRNLKGEEDFGRAALAHFEGDQNSAFPSYYTRKETLKGRYHAHMVDLIDKYAPRGIGLTRKLDDLDDLVREAFNHDTGNAAAKALNKAWQETAELARKEANLAGASILKREDWGLPQTHAQDAIRRAGKQEWIKAVTPLLDWSKMSTNSGRQFMPEAWGDVLGRVYDTITTEGMANVTPSARAQSASLATRLAQHRFLAFKDADSWLAYNRKFGDGTPYDAMVAHVEHMAHQNAMMEIFGPNPNATKEWMKAAVKQRATQLDIAEGNKTPKRLNDANRVAENIDAIYDNASGSANALQGTFWGNTFAGIRNVLTSTMMGSATLAAVPGDFFTASLARRINGIKGAGFIKNYLKLMNPLNAEDRALAKQLGLVADAATGLAYGQTRYFNDFYGPKVTRLMADVVNRVSLLTPHTQMARWAFGMEMMGHLGREVGKQFDQLDPLLRGMFKRNGIVADDWDIMRSTQLYDHKGSKFLRPDDVMNRAELGELRAKNVADKFMDMINNERQAAIPLASLRSRTAFIGRSRAGTFSGELLRSVAMLKNYPMTILNIHIRRALMQQSLAGKVAYGVAFGVGMTLAGALTIQLRQIAQGKDPIDMGDKDTAAAFWGSAALQGGGMGIWGDFLFRPVNRYGDSLAQSVLGGPVQLLGDTANLTVGNMLQVAKQEKTNFGPELVQYLKRYAPGNNLWYGRLALQRMVWDQLQDEVDPKINQKRRAEATDMRKTYKQEYWWQPGDLSPDRAPSFGR